MASFELRVIAMPALRLFIAIDLPHDVREALSLLPPAVRGVRPVKADNIHLTLHFIGQAEPEPIIEALAPVAASCAAFEMLLNGAGFFRGRHRSSVLWSGVEPVPELVALQAQLGRALQALEIAVESRPYHPHITVARGERVDAEDLHSFVDLHAGFAAIVPVTSFVLYSSSLGRGGPTYTVEHRFLLCAPPSV